MFCQRRARPCAVPSPRDGAGRPAPDCADGSCPGDPCSGAHPPGPGPIPSPRRLGASLLARLDQLSAKCARRGCSGAEGPEGEAGSTGAALGAPRTLQPTPCNPSPAPRTPRPAPCLSEPAVCPREPRFLPPVRLSGRGAQTWAGRHAWVSAPPCLRSGQRPLWCHSRVLSVYVMNIRPQEWDMIAAQHAPEAPARPARRPLSPCGPRWRLWPRPRTHAKATAMCCAPNGFPPKARPSPKKCGGASFLGHLSILTLKGSDPRPPAPGAAGARAERAPGQTPRSLRP